MSITLNGRLIQVILKQNTGNSGGDGTELDISSYLLTLGNISWSVDENLTKLSLGNLSITTTDDTSSTVWTFLTSSLASSEGLLPPWLYLNVDGVQKFVGVVREAPTRSQDSGSLEISINAVDWSSMLQSKRIEATDNTLSRINDFKNGPAYAAGTPVTCYSVYNKELRRGHDRTLVAVSTAETANFSVNDWVYFNNYDGWTQYNQKYQIMGIQTIDVGGLGVYLCLYLGSGFWWSERPQNPQNYRQQSSLYRLYQSTSNSLDTTTHLPQFIVNETFTLSTAGKTPKTSIKLNYVDGLLPGDILDKLDNISNPGSFSVTITDVDVTNNTIYIEQPLNNDLISGVTSFQINKVSLSDSVLVPLMPLVEKAVKGIAMVDYSSYAPATLPSPCLSFISPKSPSGQNIHTEALSGISDLQASLTEFQALGTAGKAWTGLPATGWDVLGSWSKVVNWTDQISSPPAYLLPTLSTPVDADPGTTETRGRTRYPGLNGYKDDRNSDPDRGSVTTPVYKMVYDYSNLRAYTFKFTPSLASVTCQTWNGSTWNTLGGFSTSGIGSPVDILPFKDATSSVASGYGLLALYKDGTVKTILSTVSYTATLKDALDSNGGLQATIKQTSNGIYYLTPSGYGKIYINGGVLKTDWVKLMDNTGRIKELRYITPISSTFVYANGRLITMAKVSYKNAITDERYIDDTYMIQLNKDIPTNATDALLAFDFIVPNIPRATMAVKSPVSEDVMGFMGGRLFIISEKLPETVERFSSINQTAQSIIEFVCAMTNTVASPLVTGKIKFHSRGFNTTPIHLTIDQVSIKESRWNQHMASCVVIKGSDSKKGLAVSTTQKSGLTISYSNDVYIRNSSQAQAIAESYLAFFEKPRREVEQEWFSQSFPASWETLEPLQVVTINSDPTQYYLVGLSHNLETQTATAQLLEVL